MVQKKNLQAPSDAPDIPDDISGSLENAHMNNKKIVPKGYQRQSTATKERGTTKGKGLLRKEDYEGKGLRRKGTTKKRDYQGKKTRNYELPRKTRIRNKKNKKGKGERGYAPAT